tara:strand:+ start:27064 stop:28116 length:1053 start_codon:yes stop_codon:yes gene_type:complete
MSNTFEINNRKIGNQFSPYIIAEVSGNHNGDISKAKELIKIAKESGADAVKLQTYTPDTMTIECDNEFFQITEGPWKGHTLYDLYKLAYTPWEWHKELFAYAKEIDITIFSTPFDESAVDFLEKLDVPAYKIASFELTDIPLIKYIASQGKPMILSTGMASLEEIQDTVDAIYSTGNKQLVILHCVSGYPTPVNESNILTIKELSNEFNTLVGLSDHTLSNAVAVTSVSLGACVIEKHFTDSRANKGPDSDFSLEPKELQELCRDVRDAHSSLGLGSFERKNSEKKSMVFRRSIFFIKDLKKGEEITKDSIRRIRPGYGLSPKNFDSLLGKTVSEDVTRGTPVVWEKVNQ